MILTTAIKKTISVITFFLLTTSFIIVPVSVGAEGETEQFTEISDAAGLAAVANAPEKSYILTEDIYLDGEDWQPISFRGKLDGAGHTIYNMRVTCVDQNKRVTRDGNLKEYDTEFAGFFSVMENAEVSNLNIKGAFVDITDRSHCFAAILSGYSDNSIVKDCSVEGRVRMRNSGKNAGVAGMVGYGTGVFERCSADVELVFEDNYKDGKCEEFLGGILSCGIAEIKQCSVHINGYDSCHGYVHNGGLVGMFYLCGTRYRGNCITDCRVEGQISFFEDNPDRRAYCKPFAGEPLTKPIRFNGNTSDFESNETKDYSKVLSPEKCDKPDYEETVIPPDCTNPGYTEHKCRGCGYFWTDSYTYPRHVAGSWQTVSESDYENEGLQRQYCSKCGVLMSQKSIPVRKVTSDNKRGNNSILPAVIGCISVVILAVVVIFLFVSKKMKQKSHSAKS